MLTRRRLLRTAAGTVAAGVATCFYTWRIEPHRLEIVRRQLPIRRLPSKLTGRTLVHLSDIHVGPRVDDDYVRATFRRVAALRPDIVAVTGDFTSYHAGLFEQVADVYRDLPKGRIATLGILGNHDYGPNWNHPEIAQRVVELVTPLGVSVLRNQTVVIQRVNSR